MRRFWGSRATLASRAALAGIALALGTALAAPAAAERAAAGSTAGGAPDGSDGFGRWRGRVCTRPGCGGAPSSPWSHAAGFGASVLAVGWIARRREPD